MTKMWRLTLVTALATFAVSQLPAAALGEPHVERHAARSAPPPERVTHFDLRSGFPAAALRHRVPLHQSARESLNPDYQVVPAPPFPPVCSATGRDGYRIRVAYVHDQGTEGRYRQAAARIRHIVTDVDRIYYLSAIATGAGRRIRFQTEATSGGGCRVKVWNIVGPPGTSTGQAGYGEDGRLAMLAAGLPAHGRYGDTLVFLDSDAAPGSYGLNCGAAAVWTDDRHTMDNQNAHGGNIGFVWKSCWGAFVAAHELGHMLGAVQHTAPHATPGGHCLDGYDVMCYQDGSTSAPMTYPCGGTVYRNELLDCHHDDYYNTAPPAGSYLASHWDVARSPFLDVVNPPSTGPPTVHITSASGRTVMPNIPFIVDSVSAAPAGRFSDPTFQEWTFQASSTCLAEPSGDSAQVACEADGSGQPQVAILRRDVMDVYDRDVEDETSVHLVPFATAAPATVTVTPSSSTVAPGTTVSLAVSVTGTPPGQPTSPLAAAKVTLTPYAQTADGEVERDPIVVRTALDGTASTSFVVDQQTRLDVQLLTPGWVSSPSPVTVDVTDTAPAPGAPVPTLAVPGIGSVDVTWHAPASDGGSPITDYAVKAQPGNHVVTVPASSSSATVPGLTPDRPYAITVAATNAAGSGPAGHLAGVVWAAAVPAAPIAVSARASEQGGLLANWEYPVLQHMDLTEVWVQDDTGAVQHVAPHPSNTWLSSLTGAHDYRLRVKACTDLACSGWSRWSEPTRADPAGYSPPETATLTALSSRYVPLRWSYPAERWVSLGGHAASAPVRVEGVLNGRLVHWSVLERPDHTVWVRRSGPWARLLPRTLTCRTPTVVAHATGLLVTCRSAAGRISYATAATESGGLPHATRLHSLGIRSPYAPGLLLHADKVQWLVTRGDHRVVRRTMGTATWHLLPGRCWSTAWGDVYLRSLYLACVGAEHGATVRHRVRGSWRPVDLLSQPAYGDVAALNDGTPPAEEFMRTADGSVWSRTSNTPWITLGCRGCRQFRVGS
jgi:hypothetical protein